MNTEIDKHANTQHNKKKNNNTCIFIDKLIIHFIFGKLLHLMWDIIKKIKTMIC